MDRTTSQVNGITMAIGIDAGTGEEEIIAAHCVRNGKVTCTVSVKHGDQGRYIVQHEGGEEIAITSTESGALMVAESFLEGYRTAENLLSPQRIKRMKGQKHGE